MLFKAEPWVNPLAINPDLHHSPWPPNSKHSKVICPDASLTLSPQQDLFVPLHTHPKPLYPLHHMAIAWSEALPSWLHSCSRLLVGLFTSSPAPLQTILQRRLILQSYKKPSPPYCQLQWLPVTPRIQIPSRGLQASAPPPFLLSHPQTSCHTALPTSLPTHQLTTGLLYLLFPVWKALPQTLQELAPCLTHTSFPGRPPLSCQSLPITSKWHFLCSTEPFSICPLIYCLSPNWNVSSRKAGTSVLFCLPFSHLELSLAHNSTTNIHCMSEGVNGKKNYPVRPEHCICGSKAEWSPAKEGHEQRHFIEDPSSWKCKGVGGRERSFWRLTWKSSRG